MAYYKIAKPKRDSERVKERSPELKRTIMGIPAMFEAGALAKEDRRLLEEKKKTEPLG